MTEEEYPFLVNKIMKYVEKVKEVDKDLSIIDIILDFSIKNNVDYETIGDAISSDVYFKSFIEKDCELHKIFKSETNNEEW